MAGNLVGCIQGSQFVAVLCSDSNRWDIVHKDNGCVVKRGVRPARVVPKLSSCEAALSGNGVQGSLDGLMIRKEVVL